VHASGCNLHDAGVDVIVVQTTASAVRPRGQSFALRCANFFVFVAAFGDASNFLITACPPPQNHKSAVQDRLLLKPRVPVISISIIWLILFIFTG
jgi:hypothetical protein